MKPKVIAVVMAVVISGAVGYRLGDRDEDDQTTCKSSSTASYAYDDNEAYCEEEDYEETEELVWITASGKKYHRSSRCSNMKHARHVDLETAQNRGYGACSKCY